jgi:hypothetical protein
MMKTLIKKSIDFLNINNKNMPIDYLKNNLKKILQGRNVSEIQLRFYKIYTRLSRFGNTNAIFFKIYKVSMQNIKHHKNFPGMWE